MKTKLMRITLPGVAALVAAFLATLPVPVQAAHDRDEIVTRDKNGAPVYRYQLQQCGVEYEHRAHWFSTRSSSHDHYCDGTPHNHRGSGSGSRPIRY